MRAPPLRTRLHIPKREKTHILKDIINDSYPKKEMFIINGVATIIAVLGYMQDSVPIVIGSMLIATMLYPVIGIGLGIVLRNRQLGLISLRSLGINLLTAISFGVLRTLLFRFLFGVVIHGGALDTDLTTILTHGFISNAINPILAIATGLASGIGAAYILSRKELNTTMAGVAIAVALVPPLAKAAIGLSYIDYIRRSPPQINPATYLAILRNGLSEFGLSVSAIIIGSALVFYFMNFDTNPKEVEKQIKKEEKEVAQEKKAAEEEREKREAEAAQEKQEKEEQQNEETQKNDSKPEAPDSSKMRLTETHVYNILSI